MEDLDELRARAEGLGIKVDGRWGFSKLCQVISDAEGAADGFATAADHDAAYAPADTSVEPEVDQEPDAPAEDGWPKRIAPCAWLDQDGNRHTDMGLAHEAAQRIRDRS